MSPWNLLIKGMLPFSLCPEKAASVSQMSSTELERPLCSLCCHTDQDLVLGSLPQVALLERRVGPDDPKDPLQPQPCCDFVTACFSRAGELALLCSKKAAQAVTLCPQTEVRRCVSDYSLGSDVTDVHFLVENHSGLQLLSSSHLQNSWPTSPFSFFP